MATLEVVRGLAQAAANGYDGAYDSEGKPIKIGLRREEGHPVLDSRTMDGFKVTFHGPVLCVNYQSEMMLKELHDKGFESGIEQTIGDITKFLKKEYKKITGDTVTLTKEAEPDILVQSTSRVRSWVQAKQYFKIGGIKDVEPVAEASEERLESAIKSWLNMGKKFPMGKKPQNVSRKQPDRPALGEVDKG